MMEFLFFIAIGILIGFLSEKYLRKTRITLSRSIATALSGSIVGGLLTFSLNFTSLQEKFLVSVITSIIGSVFFIALYYISHHAK